MKTTVKIEKEVDIKHVIIDIAIRYVGDSDDDDVPTDFPLLRDDKKTWLAKVDIDTGIIDGWPQGDSREMHAKVCDAGIYTLLDADGNTVATLSGYVPNDLVPGSYGDYVELSIDGGGKITNWPRHPDVSQFFESDD